MSESMLQAAVADAVGALPPHAPRCRNCGAAAPGQYCPECGQETRVALPTVRELMRDAAGRLVAIDGRLWRTLGLLLFRPGTLTNEYLRGRRKRYVRPARLFFFMALLAFAVVRLVTHPIAISVPSDSAPNGVTSDEAATQPKPSAAKAAASPSKGTIALDDGDEAALEQMTQKLPVELRNRIDHFRRLPAEEKAEQLNSGVLRYAPYAMVVLLPVFALLQKLAYLPGRRSQPQRPSRYAEHLVYGAHLHAFAFLMIIAIVLAPAGIVQAAIALWIVVYVTRARQKVYGGTWPVGMSRSLGVALVYMALLAVTMVALVMVAIAFR